MKLDPVTNLLLEIKADTLRVVIDKNEKDREQEIKWVRTIKRQIESVKNDIQDAKEKLDKSTGEEHKRDMESLRWLERKLRHHEGELERANDKVDEYSQRLETFKDALPKIQHDETIDTVQDVGTAVGVAAILTAAVVLGNKVYKKYFSKAAQACKQAKDKELCMKQFKAKAVQAEISQLQKAKAYCKKSKNPKQCIGKLDQEIQKNKAKL